MRNSAICQTWAQHVLKFERHTLKGYHDFTRKEEKAEAHGALVPFEEFWTEERRARRRREMKPVKGEQEFLKFMREEIARQRETRRKEEEAKRGV